MLFQDGENGSSHIIVYNTSHKYKTVTKGDTPLLITNKICTPKTVPEFHLSIFRFFVQDGDVNGRVQGGSPKIVRELYITE